MKKLVKPAHIPKKIQDFITLPMQVQRLFAHINLQTEKLIVIGIVGPRTGPVVLKIESQTLSFRLLPQLYIVRLISQNL